MHSHAGAWEREILEIIVPEESNPIDFIIELLTKSSQQKDAVVKQAVAMAISHWIQIADSDQIAKKDDFFEQFLVRFNKLKTRVRDNLGHIEVLASNNDLEFEELVVRLMYAKLRIEKLEHHHLDSKIAFVSDSYKEAWRMFQQYTLYIDKVARNILKRYFTVTMDFAKDNGVEVPTWFKNSGDKIELSPPKPSIEGLAELICYVDDAGDALPSSWKEAADDSLNGIKFLEERILCCKLYELYDRYVKAPVLLIPELIHFKNPAALYRLYEEVVRTYAGKNYLACLALCRALLEYLLNNYYECAKFNSLSDKIKGAGEAYPNLKKYRLKKNKRYADDILHNYRGEKIEETTVFDFIKTINLLIDNIPQKKQGNPCA